jgi:hypothetical protein
MNPKEFKRFREAAEQILREHDTAEKAREFLIQIGYLNPDGQVAEHFRQAGELSLVVADHAFDPDPARDC